MRLFNCCKKKPSLASQTDDLSSGFEPEEPKKPGALATISNFFKNFSKKKEVAAKPDTQDLKYDMQYLIEGLGDEEAAAPPTSPASGAGASPKMSTQ